jgi:hypothetical protein
MLFALERDRVVTMERYRHTQVGWVVVASIVCAAFFFLYIYSETAGDTSPKTSVPE